MKLMWGATQIGQTNGTRIDPQYRKVLDARFRGWAVDVVYTADTYVPCAGQADAKVKMDAIEAALRTDGQDLLFKNDDASDSTNSITNSATLGGTRCTGWQWLPDPRGAQFITGRFLRCTFEYRVLMSGLTNRLSDWSEAVEILNARPKYAQNEDVNGGAAEILVTVAQPVSRVTQSGFAVGVTAAPVYATVVPDLYSGAGVFKTVDTFRRTTPKYRGTNGTEEFRIDWRKEFISAAPFTAALNPWPAGG